MSNHPPRTLGAILYPDFELLDYYGPLEMFGTTGHGLKIVTVAETAGPVRSVQGPCTVADKSFADAPALDMLLLPGGIGTMEQLNNPAMLAFLQKRAASAEIVMSVCSGSAITVFHCSHPKSEARNPLTFGNLADDHHGASIHSKPP